MLQDDPTLQSEPRMPLFPVHPHDGWRNQWMIGLCSRTDCSALQVEGRGAAVEATKAWNGPLLIDTTS